MKPIKSNRFSLVVSACGLIFSGASYSQTVEIDPVGAIPGTHTQVQAWEFNTDGQPDGWTGNGYGPLTVAGGVISGSSTNGDPQLGNTFAAIPLGYGTIIEYGVKIDPLLTTPSAGTFFWADYGGGIAATRSRSVSIPEDNALHVVRVTFPGGVKNLTQLRLDPTSATGKIISFDYVRVYHYQPLSFTNVTLTASDAAGLTSMNTAGGWDSAAAPTTASNYFTGAFQLRTQSGTPYLPFGGSALSVDPSGSVLFKGNGGTLVRQLTLAGGSLLHGDTGVAAPNNIARLFVPDGISVTAASTIGTVAVNRTIEITGSLSGSGALGVTGGAAPANAGPGNVPAAENPGRVLLKSDSAGYSGTLTVGANSWLDLDSDNAVAGANVVVSSGGMVRRIDADASGTTTAASWALTGRGPTSGVDANRGALYFSHNGLAANLVGPISISGTQSRIGTFSATSALTLDGTIGGTGTLELWGGGGAESHVQTFILNGAATHDGQTDLLADFGSQTHLRLGGDDRLPTTKRLRISAIYGTNDLAGGFLDLGGFDQTLSSLLLDGSKRKFIRDTTASGNSVLTLTANTNAFDANGGNISINGITITHTGANNDSGATIDNASAVNLTGVTWNGPFYITLGNGGAGSLTLNNSSVTVGGELLMARSNSVATLTVDATSLVTTPNYIRMGDSATGTATVNLNGGILAARGFRNLTASTSILNLNNGTLKATSSNMNDWITGVNVKLLAGGIKLDSNNHQVISLVPILEDAGSTGGGITKIGAGNVTLAGANTYTGATSVTEGNLLIDGNSSAATGAISVSASAGLGGDGVINNATYAAGANFPWNVADWTAAPGLSAGTVTIAGALKVVVDDAVALTNFTDADASFTILSASALNVVNPAALAVDATAFTAGTGTWSVQKDGNTLKLVYTAVPASVASFATWAAAFSAPVLSPAGAAADADFDGLSNSVEYVIGGDPRVSSQVGRPTSTTAAGVIAFAFSRADSSETPDVTTVVQVSSDLVDWTTLPSYTVGVDTAASTAGVVVTENGAAADDITVTVPNTGAAKKFARLTVVTTP